jgi:hypothetical protein
LDKTGKEVIPVKYNSIVNFSEDLLKVNLEGKYGVLNRNGQEVIPIQYDEIGAYSNGLVPVKIANKFGFIDETGKTVIPIKYDAAGSFVNGFANVQLGETTGKIDTDGTFTAQSMKLSLMEAIQKKYVRFSARGSSISSSYISVENVSDMKLNLVIQAGTFLSANSSSYQNMVLTSPQDIVVEARNTYSGSVNTACMNISRDIPDGDNSFGLTQHPNNHLLTKVIKLLNEGNYSYSVKQAAVWIVTDGANYYDMGILQNQYGQRTIDNEDYQKAVSIVNNARKK